VERFMPFDAPEKENITPLRKILENFYLLNAIC